MKNNLDIDSGNDVDTGIQHIQYILCQRFSVLLPEILVWAGSSITTTAACSSRMACTRPVLPTFCLCKKPPAAETRAAVQQGFGLPAVVCFYIADFNVYTTLQQSMDFLQHAVRFVHAGTHADIKFELAFRAPEVADLLQPFCCGILLRSGLRNRLQ